MTLNYPNIFRGEEIMNAYEQGKKKILDTFSVKGFKTWEAREGVGAQTTLYLKTTPTQTKIGTCEGNGGEVDFRADTTTLRTMVWDFIKELPAYKYADMWASEYGESGYDCPNTYTMKDGEAVLDPDPMESWTLFHFANVMLTQAEIDTQLRKQCRKKILVRYEGETDYRIFNVKWPDNKIGQTAIMEQLTEQVKPNVIAEVINKRFEKGVK